MDLQQRVERLERRNRRTIVWMMAAVGVAVACMGAMQRAKPSESVDTKMLKLLDDKGNLRAFLTATPKGNVSLTMIDQHEKVCAVFGVTADACPSLELSHSDGKLRARMALAPDGHAALEFYDAEGKIIRSEPAAK
jgi:hypothetical protein